MIRSQLRNSVARSVAAAACALSFALGGCASVPPGPVLTVEQFENMHPSAEVLGPGDRLRINLYGDAAINNDYEIGSDGAISLPLVGSVTAGGLSVEQLRTALADRLSRGFYTDPKVSIQLLTSRKVYVLGEVNRAGAFDYAPDMTLAKAAALAGGYSYRARFDKVVIRRSQSRQEVVVKADQAMAIAAGDTIRVLERSF